jgi:phosphoribosylglycinamide formyltransferase 2
MLLGSGELGKEIAIELIRLGVEVHACDGYSNAPAQQVAQFSHEFDMLDPVELYKHIAEIKPDIIVPEIEAIATQVLEDIEQSGVTVVPNARAIQLTMNREGIRTLAAKELKLPTSRYKFAETEKEFAQVVHEIGMPCIVKPIMSSSGKGQSVVSSFPKIGQYWKKAQEEGRAGGGKVIVEEIIDFDYEVTLLTVRNKKGTLFCEPIGHRQVDGDYIESWQACEMSDSALTKAKDIANKITTALGGYGVFGVELFVKGDEVYFSEVSPRPHDTGLVTIVSQNQSEFELHAKSILGLPVNTITYNAPSASHVIKIKGYSDEVSFSNLENALDLGLYNYDSTEVSIRLFGKPGVYGQRRMGVVLVKAEDIEQARSIAKQVNDNIEIKI